MVTEWLWGGCEEWALLCVCYMAPKWAYYWTQTLAYIMAWLWACSRAQALMSDCEEVQVCYVAQVRLCGMARARRGRTTGLSVLASTQEEKREPMERQKERREPTKRQKERRKLRRKRKRSEWRKQRQAYVQTPALTYTYT